MIVWSCPVVMLHQPLRTLDNMGYLSQRYESPLPHTRKHSRGSPRTRKPEQAQWNPNYENHNFCLTKRVTATLWVSAWLLYTSTPVAQVPLPIGCKLRRLIFLCAPEQATPNYPPRCASSVTKFSSEVHAYQSQQCYKFVACCDKERKIKWSA